MKRKRKKCSDQRKAVSCDKDQGIQRGMESKRKKCSDQGKEGELSFSYQSLVAVPPVFLTFVSSSMFFWNLL